MAAPHSQHLTAMKNETGVNVDALSAEHTQFHGSTPRDKPLTAKGVSTRYLHLLLTFTNSH